MNQQYLMNMLLNRLKNNNPQGYNKFMSLYNSGENPNNILKNMLNSGQITQSQIDDANNVLNGMNKGPKTF